MNLFRRILILFSLIPTLYAADAPLNNSYNNLPVNTLVVKNVQTGLGPLTVAIESYNPPFEQGTKEAIYGYDIDMINYLCKTIQRTCQFKVMKFEQILDAVANKQVDMAVSAITITAERAKIVNFSMPYLLSYSRFLTNHSKENKGAFSLSLLKDKKIGVVEGSIFPEQIKQMGIINPSINSYSSTENLLEALSKNDIDFILLDNPSAVYWEANSTGAFTAVGIPYIYGFGLGIAINSSEKDLLNSINNALLQYQNSKLYKQNYDTYLKPF
jgi:polar amino acid transport system substrate-binding protein